MPEMQESILEQAKECTKCKVTLPLDSFYKHKLGKNGLHPRCKKCLNIQHYIYVKKYPQKKYKNTVRFKENKKEYQRSNKYKEWSKKYRQNDKYKERRRKYNREYVKRMKTENPQFKLAKILRDRLSNAIKYEHKAGSAIRDLGCSVSELKIYLEKQFQIGMAWENHGTWHLDHILPIASFDLTDREQFLKACHYTNLQPLWAKDNLTKGKSYPHVSP